METRFLSGMTYSSLEVDHLVSDPMPEVLRTIATWLEDNGADHGLLTNITTQLHVEDDDRFLTTLVWAE